MDIDESCDYVLLLLENDIGFREFELREVSRKSYEVDNSQCKYMTKTIPIHLVLSRDLDAIAEAVKLSNDKSFGFDSNGRWMTEAEIIEFKESFNRGVNEYGVHL